MKTEVDLLLDWRILLEMNCLEGHHDPQPEVDLKKQPCPVAHECSDLYHTMQHRQEITVNNAFSYGNDKLTVCFLSQVF